MASFLHLLTWLFGHLAAAAGWTLLSFGIVVLSWASWQLAGFWGRQPMNGENYWGVIAYVYFAVPAAGVMALALVLIGLGHVV